MSLLSTFIYKVLDLSFPDFLEHIGVKGDCSQIAQLLQDELSIYDADGIIQFQPTLEQLEGAGIEFLVDRKIIVSFANNTKLSDVELSYIEEEGERARMTTCASSIFL
jgi:hypothetical protein